MDIATVLSVAKTVLTSIDTLEQLKETFSFSHYQNELERFQETVNTVQSVLKDADANKEPLNNQQINYIEKLKDAVYDANDVLDEFVTLVKRKQANEASDKVSDKVRSFLFRFTRRLRSLSSKIKDINAKLDKIASDKNKFNFEVGNKPINFVERETSSCVSVKEPIIGRDEDLEKIVEMLLNSSGVHQPRNVSSLAIVGMGGLGKTAFAQLVYNDPRITSAFQLRSWTCIADQDEWKLTHVLGKILKDLSNQNLTSLEQMHREIRKQLEGKKYLLVLDDVWNESYSNWQELEKFLMVGESGSRIVVTTRSKTTAEIIGGVCVHELQGLSEDESWHLFERMAFRKEQRENPDEDFVKLGKEIVKKCFNVPLAIRVVGSLLHGVPKSNWLSFREKELTNIRIKSNNTMNKILSLSYNRLDPSLKSCFAYCAIFPKDFEIDKKMLISLWMAQGFINVEYVGEEYFRILLQRCFFQDVSDDEMDEIISFKIHDLLHDIAEQVAGNEICRLNSDPLNEDKKVRHLCLLNGFCPQETFNKANIRTCHQIFEISGSIIRRTRSSSDQILVLNSIANWTSLRSLDLRFLLAKRLPESIGKLFHLRYLNLSYSENLEVLPDSITKLVNLQTLELCKCENLTELPKDMCKLVDLRTLNITDCDNLGHMPSKMGMLTQLHTLCLYVVGRVSSYEKQCFDGLDDLGSLNNLKGFIEILIVGSENGNYVKEKHGGGAYLMDMVHLHEILINFSNQADESIEWEQALLKEMQPPTNISVFSLEGYSCETIPRWPRREDNSTLFYFPNLVNLHIRECQHLRFLPPVEKLPHLKEFTLWRLPNLEYVVNNNLEASSLGEGASFFPCIEYISITELPKLKGWWPGSEEQNEDLVGEPFSNFAQLKVLRIDYCPMLKSIPICSSLNSVWVRYDFDRAIHMHDIDELSPNYKCLLPTESKSRMITLSYFETFLAN